MLNPHTLTQNTMHYLGGVHQWNDQCKLLICSGENFGEANWNFNFWIIFSNFKKSWFTSNVASIRWEKVILLPMTDSTINLNRVQSRWSYCTKLERAQGHVLIGTMLLFTAMNHNNSDTMSFLPYRLRVARVYLLDSIKDSSYDS